MPRAARRKLTIQRGVPCYERWWMQDSAGASAFGVNATAEIKIYNGGSSTPVFTGSEADVVTLTPTGGTDNGEIVLNIPTATVATLAKLVGGSWVLNVDDPDQTEGWPVRVFKGACIMSEEGPE